MILRKFDIEQTNELIDSIHRHARNLELIGEESCLIIEKAYSQYLTNFKTGIFFWRAPLSIQEVVRKMNAYSSYASIERYHTPNMQYFGQLLTDGFRIFRVLNHMNCVDATVFAKHDVFFTKKEFDLLVDASSLWDSTIHSPIKYFHKKVKVVLAYAEQPFAIEEDDIAFIEEMKRLVTKSDSIVKQYGLK